MAEILSQEQIESVIDNLPPQNRTMIRLLLLQYLDVSKDDIAYMSADQPDSRFQSGRQPDQKASDVEGVRDISSRVDQYRFLLRQKRERPWLQIECLKNQISLLERTIAVAEEMLATRFDLDAVTLQEQKKTAYSALPKPEIRRMNKAWDKEEISEDDFRKERLLIEYQTLLRRLERYRRRLAFGEREFQSAGAAPLQDHEIAHIWGIPLGALAGRKVKALHQYLTTLHTQLQKNHGPASGDSNSPPEPQQDLWKETFATLSRKAAERSVVSYGGIERNEEALMEKLNVFANGDLPEEEESGFWSALIRINDTEHSGSWANHSKSIFALQRLSAIQAELDPTPDELEQKLLGLCTPKSLADALPAQESPDQPLELNEEALGVLNAFIGEQDDKRRT